MSQSKSKNPRSHPAKPAVPQKVVLDNENGSVRVYTRRHINGCRFTSPDQQSCSCPKWIYANPRGGRPTRFAAGTPSFTEAFEQARKLWRGWDPEIRQARAVNTPAPGIRIEDALAKYYEVLASRRLSPGYMSHTVVACSDRRKPRRDGRGKLLAGGVTPVNLPLLAFLDQINRIPPPNRSRA